MVLVGAIRRLDRTAPDPQCRRGARAFPRWSICRPTMRRRRCSARPSRWKISSASKTMLRGPDPFRPKSKGLRRTEVAEMAVAMFPGDGGMEDRVRSASSKGRATLRRDLRRVPPRTGQRSRVRPAIPGQELLVLRSAGTGPDRPDPVLMPVQKSVAGMGTDPAQANVLASRRSTFPASWTCSRRAISARAWKCREPAEPTPRRKCRSRSR